MPQEQAQRQASRVWTDNARRYVELTEQKRAMQGELNALNDELRAVETGLVDDMLQAEVQNVSIAGYTVYLRNQLYARARDNDHVRLVRALLDSGREDLIVMGVQRLKGELRDEETLQGLPTAVREALEVETLPRIGCRKSSA